MGTEMAGRRRKEVDSSELSDWQFSGDKTRQTEENHHLADEEERTLKSGC